MVGQLLPVIILVVFVIIFGSALIGLALLLGQKVKYNAIKAKPYECGVIGDAPIKTQIPIKFYLTAISFILFDIEIVFLYPFSIIFVENIRVAGAALLLTTGIFVVILTYGLFYEWKAGALEWD